MFKKLMIALTVVGVSLGAAMMSHSTVAFAQEKTILDEIKARGVLLAGAAEDRPYQWRNADGTWDGYLSKVVELYAESIGVKLEWVPTTFTVMVAALESGKFDIAGAHLHATEGRLKVIDFTDPLFFSGTSVFVNRESAEKYKDLAGLDDPSVTIAVQGGSADEPVARKQFTKANILALPNVSPADLVMQVKTNKATGITLTNIYSSALEKKFDLVAFPKDAKGLEPVPGSFGVRKKDPALTASINAFLQKMKDEGKLQELEKQYLTPEAFLNVFEQN